MRLEFVKNDRSITSESLLVYHTVMDSQVFEYILVVDNLHSVFAVIFDCVCIRAQAL